MQQLISPIQNFSLIDLIDIVMVAAFFYAIFTLLRGSRSFLALTGFITFVVASLLIYLLAQTWDLEAMTLIFQNVWLVVLLVFLLVFQSEFRKALTDLGQIRIFRPFFTSRERDVLDEVLNAVHIMSNRNVGALLAFERRNPLKSYTDTGTEIDSSVSSELIRTIFTSYSPLHDGALILKGERLVAAGCILPLSDNPTLSTELGTRHRAAIGLSEETDAIVVVVSEETGTISLAVDGILERGLKIDELRKRLQRELNIPDLESSSEEGVDAA